QRFLLRPADPSGLNTFVNVLLQGGAVEEVAAALAGSGEYFETRGNATNDGFLDALYSDALHRSVDSVGRAAWDQALAAGATRGQVAAAIFASGEYRQDLVQ